MSLRSTPAPTVTPHRLGPESPAPAHPPRAGRPPAGAPRGDRIVRTTAAPAGYVAHGSLEVRNSIEAPFERASAYLDRDTAMRSVISRAEQGATRTYVDPTATGLRDAYDPRSHDVTWSPHTAFTVPGGRISPAIALGHELDHATADPMALARGMATSDPVYDTAEERRVVTGSEDHAERTLHEPVRTSHHVLGVQYVASPIEH